MRLSALGERVRADNFLSMKTDLCLTFADACYKIFSHLCKF